MTETILVPKQYPLDLGALDALNAIKEALALEIYPAADFREGAETAEAAAAKGRT